MNYTLYQQLLCAISNRDSEALEIILQTRHSEIVSSYMKTSLKTLSNVNQYDTKDALVDLNDRRLTPAGKATAENPFNYF